jgi:hypothetical protein
MNDSFFQRVYPQYNYRIPVISRADGSVEFGDHQLSSVPSSKSVEWFMSLDGSHSAQQASVEGSERIGVPRQVVTTLLIDGFQSGALIDSRTTPRTSRWLNEKGRARTHTDMACAQKHVINYKDKFPIQDAAEIIDRRSAIQIELVGQGSLAEAIHQLGLESGCEFTQQRSCASVVVFVSSAHPRVFEHVNSHLCSLPHLHVGTRLDSAQIGPLVIPGESSCFRCAQLHHRDSSPDWMGVDLQWRHHANSGESDSILTYQTAAYTLLLLRHWIDGMAITNTAWSATLPWLRFQARPALPHPLCGCQLHTSDFTG